VIVTYIIKFYQNRPIFIEDMRRNIWLNFLKSEQDVDAQIIEQSSHLKPRCRRNGISTGQEFQYNVHL